MSNAAGHEEILRKFAQKEIAPEKAAEALRNNQKLAGQAIHAFCRKGGIEVKQAGELLQYTGEQAQAAALLSTLDSLGERVSTVQSDSPDAKLLEHVIKNGGNFDEEGIGMVRQYLSRSKEQAYGGAISIIGNAAQIPRLAEALGGDRDLALKVRQRAKLSLISSDIGEHVGRSGQGSGRGGGGLAC